MTAILQKRINKLVSITSGVKYNCNFKPSFSLFFQAGGALGPYDPTNWVVILSFLTEFTQLHRHN